MPPASTLKSSLLECAGRGAPVLKWVPSAGHHASYASAKRASRTRCAVRDACTGIGQVLQVLWHFQANSGRCSDKRLRWARLGVSAVLFKLRQQASKLQLQCIALAALPNMMHRDMVLAPCQAVPLMCSRYGSESRLLHCSPRWQCALLSHLVYYKRRQAEVEVITAQTLTKS